MSVDTYEDIILRDISETLYKHRNHDPAKLAKLVSVAFGSAIGPGKSHEEKRRLALARGSLMQQELKEAEGGSLSSEEAARLLGISKTAILKRLDKGKLLAWREERLKAARFPVWQFDSDGKLLPGLREVLECFENQSHLDDWAKVLFFLQNKSRLGDKRPLDLLRDGDLSAVLREAEAYAE